MQQLTIERAAAIILFALLFALAARIPVDTDTWWHIRSGEYTLAQGMIYTDPFSLTRAGEPWVNHSWGAQLILAAVWRVGGNLGLAVYVAALATAGMALVYGLSPGNVYLRAFTTVLGAAAAAVFWSARPQMLSFVLSAGVLYILCSFRRRHADHLWWLPVIMGIWGNLHAGFSIGFILMLGTIAGAVLTRLFQPDSPQSLSWGDVRKLTAVTVVSAAALVVNPYGLRMLAVPFQTVNIGALQNFIQEWNSPNFHDRSTWPFVGLLLGLLGAAGASRKRLGWTDFVLVSGTAFMALTAGRNIAVFAVVATPVLAEHLEAVLAERGWVVQPVRRVTPRMARLNALLVGLVLVGSAAKVLLVLDARTVAAAQAEFLPVKAAAFIQAERPPGPMFNSYNWGGYLMFTLPDYPVFVDGRTDLYGDDFLTRTYLPAATGGSDWRSILDRYGIRLVVVERDSGLARRLRDLPVWTLAHEDEIAVVFTREGGDA